MEKKEIAFMNIIDQAKLIKKKKLSPVELVNIYIERIEKWDNVLNSWITVCAERAIKNAKRAENEISNGNYRGPLHGIPYGVKDQICSGDVPTTLASKIKEDFGGSINATVIDKMNQAGAILLGKNNMSEFGKGSSVNFHFGEPRNPWNLEHEPSHSSSGSAISIAAGLCSFSIAEDTGGSIRGPAWANGVVGIRPTFGRVSRYGGIMFAWTQDTIGPLTRSVKDNALLLNKLSGFDPKDSLSSRRPVKDYTENILGGVNGIKIGLIREMSVGVKLHPEVEDSLYAALKVFESLGAKIKEISLPIAKLSVPLQFLTSDADVASLFLDKWLRQYWDEFDQGIRTRIAAAALIPVSVYNRAMRARVLVRQQILQSLKECDVLIALMNFTPPAPIVESKEKIDSKKDAEKHMYKSRRICTFPFSIANVPTISVPTGFTKNNLPTAIQIAGKPFDEDIVYRVAYAYEQATTWHLQHPDLDKTVNTWMKIYNN